MNRLLILTLFMLISYAACEVVVSESKQSKLVPGGGGYTLRCTVSGNDTFEKWDNKLYTSSLENNPDIKYTNNNPEHDLEIVSMNVYIAGKWTCYSREGNSDYIKLTFPPSIVTKVDTQQILVKDVQGAIYVNIRGYPLPRFIWKKEGVPLNISGRYSVDSNGTLLISNVESGDEGNYIVRANQGFAHTESDIINVTLHVAPSINGTAILENRTIGGNISFECSASGVPEPTVAWRKGEDLITNGGRFTISKSGLIITSIMLSDVGDYKCVASNSAGTKELTSSLLSVLVPPAISPLRDREVEQGASLQVSCNATGNPAPIVEWYKDGNLVSTSQQMKSLGESVLKFTNIQIEQAGVYECTAMNGAVDSMGKEIKRSRSIAVKVVYPPRFDDVKELIHVRLNYPVTINCSASGIPLPDIKLYRGSEDIQATITNTSTQSTLIYFINNTNADDLGLYTCIASSTLNTAQKDITLSVPLDKPEISNVTRTCSGVNFSWHHDIQDYIKVKSYQVTVTRSADQLQVKNKLVSSNISEVTFGDLEENTEYKLTVRQITDVVNIGHETSAITKTTRCPLTDINDIDQDGNAVAVYWPEARKSINYTLKYRIKGLSVGWSNKTTERNFIKLSGLVYGETYEFKVVYEDAGKEIPYTNVREAQISKASTSTTRSAGTTQRPPTTEETTESVGKPPGKVARKEGLSGGAIAAIVIVIILLVLIAVDIFCCFFNQCGVVHMCAAACAGKGRDKYTMDGTAEEGTKLKEIDEEGKRDPEA